MENTKEEKISLNFPIPEFPEDFDFNEVDRDLILTDSQKRDVDFLINRIYSDHYEDMHYTLDMYSYQHLWTARLTNIDLIDKDLVWRAEGTCLHRLLFRVWHFVNILKRCQLNNGNIEFLNNKT